MIYYLFRTHDFTRFIDILWGKNFLHLILLSIRIAVPPAHFYNSIASIAKMRHIFTQPTSYTWAYHTNIILFTYKEPKQPNIKGKLFSKKNKIRINNWMEYFLCTIDPQCSQVFFFAVHMNYSSLIILFMQVTNNDNNPRSDKWK